MLDWSLAVFVVLCIVAASSGALFQPGAWYETLDKPSWTPPNWSFGVVWTILFLMIAVAGWLVWRAGGWSLPVVLWGAQLVVNAAWSWLFFGRRRMDLAFVDVVLLWLLIAAFIVSASALSGWAALLFVPYLVWVSIAAALNRSVWRRNPQVA
ncbi:TspO/MBR family protein [Aquibium microcysteis]|uniref:TspO/MBR family protein n=1 Tax=Aquibium microcysteis TaxID=675281 RepID=UPI00165D2BA3|nr:TspO/MBR family protein [Aquibium microcysteis]